MRMMQRILPCTGWHAAPSRLPPALPARTHASLLLDRLASNRHTSTSTTTPPNFPPGIKLRPRTTPPPPEATPNTSSSVSSRVRRNTQQFFDDDDDWSSPVDVEVPTIDRDDEVDESWKPTATPTGAAAVKSQPMHVHVKTAEFVKSSRNRQQCPAPRLPEFAVIGRSNVGKSSLINMITGKRNLALVSKTPGKTVCINHFLINNSWYLVDLPGYGYARRSKTERGEWSDFTRDYFLHREVLANVLLLVDSSVPPQDIDLESADWLGDSQVPYTLVFTKYDKKKKRAPSPDDNINAFVSALAEKWETMPPALVTSASTGYGKPELLRYIASMRMEFERTALTDAL